VSDRGYGRPVQKAGKQVSFRYETLITKRLPVAIETAAVNVVCDAIRVLISGHRPLAYVNRRWLYEAE